MNGGVGLIQIPNPHPFPPPTATTSPRIKSNKSIHAVAAETNEIRVCTNRTCRRQGSTEVLQVLSGIAPATVSVNSCGCLGRCGAGPNLVILPSATFVSHCATAARAAEVMSIVCGFDSVSCQKSLEALSMRKKAEGEMEKGDFATAEILLSQAIDLNPVGGVHYIYKARSVARLAMNKPTAALEDAVEASTLAPTYPEAYLCKGDALMAMEQYEAAGDSYSMALELDPSIRRSKSFKGTVHRRLLFTRVPVQPGASNCNLTCCCNAPATTCFLELPPLVLWPKTTTTYPLWLIPVVLDLSRSAVAYSCLACCCFMFRRSLISCLDLLPVLCHL